MNIDTIFSLPPLDILLLAVMFLAYIFVCGSIIQAITSEYEYYQWKKTEVQRHPQKPKRKAASQTKPAKSLRKARA